MSIALQVEKTSKRGGRIIHEKEFLMPPPLAPSPPAQAIIGPVIPVQEPTITEIMKSPSKVVLLRVSYLISYFSNGMYLNIIIFSCFVLEYGWPRRCR